MGAYSRGGGLLTIFSSRVGAYWKGGGAFLRGGQFEDLRYLKYKFLSTPGKMKSWPFCFVSSFIDAFFY